MDWENETYVRLYVRDTVTWLNWSFEARAVLGLLLRKLDRAGVLDLSGFSPVDAVSAVIMAPKDFVEAGLPQLLDSGTVLLDEDRLLMPNYIPAQEATSSNAQRARLHRAKQKALEKQRVRNDSLRERNATKPTSRKRGKKSARQRNDSLSDRNDSLRQRNDSLRNRNATLHHATPRNEKKDGASAPSSPSSAAAEAKAKGVDASRLAETRERSFARHRVNKGGGADAFDESPADPSLFCLQGDERKKLAELLTDRQKTKPAVAKQRKLLARVESEVLRVFKRIRYETTGLDIPIKGADATKSRKAAQKLGRLCIVYGLTPEQLIEHWAKNNWTEQKFPSLMWLASESNIDQAAMVLLKMKANPQKKGPMEAVREEDWTDSPDDAEALVKAAEKRRKRQGTARTASR